MTTMTAQATQVYQVFIGATPEQIWEAITTPEFTTKYFHGSAVESTLEPGSPWSVRLHVDAAGDERQRTALEHVFLDGIVQLPWIRKERHVIGVTASTIEIDGTHVNVGPSVSVHASRPVEDDVAVRCGIPGYDREGYELYADELVVDDDPFAWQLSGNCAFTSDFDYSSPG